MTGGIDAANRSIQKIDRQKDFLTGALERGKSKKLVPRGYRGKRPSSSELVVINHCVILRSMETTEIWQSVGLGDLELGNMGCGFGL